MKNLDYETLRKDLCDYASGAYFGGNIGAAALYYEKIKQADEEELEKIAKECNFPIHDYEIDDYQRRI
ncbi:MAG: hypothetical protein IJ097_02955 [Bacilli bacterium]|nr:hypothetical protein [Bacilli bacterium]